MLNALLLLIHQLFIKLRLGRNCLSIAFVYPLLCFSQIVNAADSASTAIEPVAVTANPLGVSSDALVTPVSTLNGRELSLRRESTLGETLNGIPGVSSTYFGPVASRPVIRGLDAERVRLMQNGLGIMDASSLSFDHAVALDPLIIEQIDVVRGPAALLYGGSAVGGVVNAIDHRIPKEAIDGVLGRAEARFGGADDQKNGAVVLDAGNGILTLHADAYGRKTNDLRIPGFSRTDSLRASNPNPDLDRSGKLVNSGSEASGGALGASVQLGKGYVGASYSRFDNFYGSVIDPAVKIDQKSDRMDLASEFSGLGSFIHRIKTRFAYTDYQHQELEDGAVGTTFKNQGVEGSVELGHAKIGAVTGVVGFQFQNSRFSAIGDEAFVPSNRTNSQAAYVYEELPLDKLKLSLGGRMENVSVDSQGGGTFGAAISRNFQPKSLATGALWTLDKNWSLAANLSHNERAPSYFELYANGPHIATGQFEAGNADLGLERANGIDSQLRWKSGAHSLSFSAYYTRFQNFISLQNDPSLNDPLEGLIGARFVAVPATFKGMEAEGKFRLMDTTGNLDAVLRADYVRAENRDTSAALPRIAPFKLGAGLRYQYQAIGARMDVLHAFSQDRTALNETATDSYTNLSAMFTYLIPARFQLEAFLKANNLLDETIREHTSFLKDVAPLAGRSLLIGLRGEF